jgi:hypothetical protein
METEKSISQLVKEAKENEKIVVLMAGDSHHEKMALEIARMENVAPTEIVVIKTNKDTILEELKLLTEFKDIIVVIEDIDKMMSLPVPPKSEVLKLHAMPREVYDVEILSDKKKGFGVSKNKKTFSPPKHKGFNNHKVNHRGKHR